MFTNTQISHAYAHTFTHLFETIYFGKAPKQRQNCCSRHRKKLKTHKDWFNSHLSNKVYGLRACRCNTHESKVEEKTNRKRNIPNTSAKQ